LDSSSKIKSYPCINHPEAKGKNIVEIKRTTSRYTIDNSSRPSVQRLLETCEARVSAFSTIESRTSTCIALSWINAKSISS